jgi:hypothetical protein
MNINVVMLLLAEYVIKYHMESDRADGAEQELQVTKESLATTRAELEAAKAKLEGR